MAAPNKDARIVIVGAGTFGLSTAYHLIKAGYTSITLLEKGPTVPSPESAANDINKIIRAEYEDVFYTNLALEAIEAWASDPLFSPHYHQVGYLLCNSASAPAKTRKTLAKSLDSIARHPVWRGNIHPINNRDDAARWAPQLDGEMQGWEGYFNAIAGYAHAANALAAVRDFVVSRGAKIITGEEVVGLVYGAGHACKGVVTASKDFIEADTVVLTLGANLGRLLPSIGRQITAKAWSVLHVRLTPEEAARLKGIPVTYARDIGFYFEPEPGTGILKICPSGGGYTNFHEPGHEGVSVAPPAGSVGVPEADEALARRLLRETVPWLADRPLVDRFTCWCADSADSEFVIDAVPGAKGLVVATGDSGHGFKMFPVVGGWIKDVVEKGTQEVPRWRWKEGSDAGMDVSWRAGVVTDVKDLPGGVRAKL